MKREPVYYTVISVGMAVILALLIWQFWPQPAVTLDPPQVVAQRLASGKTTDEKVRAARDFIRHGPAARLQVRAALDEHAALAPEVVAPLLQATMKNRDYRSLPTVIQLLEHPDPLVRGRAGAAVRKILGADFGFRANATEDERARIISLIKQDYENAQPRIQEFYRDQGS
jgi:hypothetical protein